MSHTSANDIPRSRHAPCPFHEDLVARMDEFEASVVTNKQILDEVAALRTEVHAVISANARTEARNELLTDTLKEQRDVRGDRRKARLQGVVLVVVGLAGAFAGAAGAEIRAQCSHAAIGR